MKRNMANIRAQIVQLSICVGADETNAFGIMVVDVLSSSSSLSSSLSNALTCRSRSVMAFSCSITSSEDDDEDEVEVEVDVNDDDDDDGGYADAMAEKNADDDVADVMDEALILLNVTESLRSVADCAPPPYG